MACCLCSKSWIALLLPTFALFTSFFPSSHGILSISITLSLILIIFSTLFSFKISKEKEIMVDEQEKALLIKEDKEVQEAALNQEVIFQEVIFQEKEEEEESGKGLLLKSQDLLYSESESMDHFSSEEEEEEDHSLRMEFSDDSISDEESDLIEISIPSGEFVSNNSPEIRKEYSKGVFGSVDFLADINEEDNLIEIDIYMGSIKCSSFVEI